MFQSADLIVSHLAITESRISIVDFTYPFFIDEITVLFKRIDPLSMKWRLFVEPFRYTVWASLAVSAIFVGFIISFVSKLTPVYSQGWRKKGLARIKHAMFFTFGSIMQQGKHVFYLPE